MDTYEAIETIVWINPAEADKEGLPCGYCGSAEVIPYERVRAEPHPACLNAVVEYEANHNREGRWF